MQGRSERPIRLFCTAIFPLAKAKAKAKAKA